MQRSTGESVIDETHRHALHVFVDPAHWIGSFVSHFAAVANRTWNLSITGLGTLSLVRYRVGGRFGWHVDTLAYEQTDYDDLGADLYRKLSVTINLTDPDDYDGGDLQFINAVGQQLVTPDLRPRGTIIVFPSTLGHQVTPLTRGVRHALVGWLVGPNLR